MLRSLYCIFSSLLRQFIRNTLEVKTLGSEQKNKNFTKTFRIFYTMRFSCFPAFASAAALVAVVDGFQSICGLWGQKKSISSHHTNTGLFAINNNIVLRPSEDKTKFDSLKIGGCRVHRYARENDPDSETEYIMWYHGRSEEQDQDKTLPPLSTGRIGRATSKNGLVWKKDTVGSVSEDVNGVAVGLNAESWWGFDTAHVGLGSVLLPMSTPAIQTDGGVYLMYYMGGSFEETPIGAYTEKEMPADATIKGMKMKIGICVSQDGITWGRVEGDDPSGACMVPFDLNDPNTQGMIKMLDDNGSKLNLKEELYCAWPEVVVKIDKFDQTKSGFFMYYSTMVKETKEKGIAYAVSKDGFRWEKRGLCVMPDGGTQDAGGCARCNVFRNAVFDESTSAWSDAPGYTMLYEGVSKEDNKHRIMMAESSDGRAWTKRGVVFDIGEGDSWDSQGVGSPHILRMDDGSMRMYYVGQGSDASTAVGVAKCSDGKSTKWEREQATIVFAEA